MLQFAWYFNKKAFMILKKILGKSFNNPLLLFFLLFEGFVFTLALNKKVRLYLAFGIEKYKNKGGVRSGCWDKLFPLVAWFK